MLYKVVALIIIRFQLLQLIEMQCIAFQKYSCGFSRIIYFLVNEILAQHNALQVHPMRFNWLYLLYLFVKNIKE